MQFLPQNMEGVKELSNTGIQNSFRFHLYNFSAITSIKNEEWEWNVCGLIVEISSEPIAKKTIPTNLHFQ